MDENRSLLTPPSRVQETSVAHPSSGPILGTRDHDVIQRWAHQHQAEPSTGERTHSGPATTNVNDGGAGIRFNFPAVSVFRPISWKEWFENFDQHELTFVFEQKGDGTSSRYRIVSAAEWSGQVDPRPRETTTEQMGTHGIDNERSPAEIPLNTPSDWRRMTKVAHDHIAHRAFQLYEDRGGEPGHDIDDWLMAEHEIQLHNLIIGPSDQV